MTFSIRNLSNLGYAQGFTPWHYHTADDSVYDTLQPGYFDDAGMPQMAGMLHPGDTITINAKDGNAIVFVARPGTHRPSGRVSVIPYASPIGA